MALYTEYDEVATMSVIGFESSKHLALAQLPLLYLEGSIYSSPGAERMIWCLQTMHCL